MRLEADMPPPRLSVIETGHRRSATLSHEHLLDRHVVGFDKMNARAQPFIQMRAKLLNFAAQSGRNVFAVTSIEPGAGKTHIAVNLAAVLSRIKPTVLVELDLRRPSIADRLGLSPPQRGVDDYLAGNARWSELGTRIDGFDLTVHCARTSRADTEGLLSSQALPKLLQELRSSKDQPICIIDASPLTVEDDFMLLGTEVDGVLMVVDEGRTDKHTLVKAAKSIKPTPIVGTVLNRSMWTTSKSGYYGY